MAKIDPAFQAAPVLGGTNYDPIAFARRNRMEKFQIQRKQEEDQAKNTAQGLENLMVDVKGWEDQQGFKEIMADQNRVMNGFLDLSKKGLNLVSPKTTQEIMAYKAINDAHEQIKQKVDTWNQQKGIYDLYTKAIEKDSILPPEEQEIDHGATIANVQKVLKTKDIMGRGTDLQNLVVTKTKPVDVFKDVLANKDIFEKGTQSQNVVEMPDGSKQISMVENLTPQQTEANAKKAGQLFESKPQAYKDAVKKIREADPEPKLNVMSDKDYYKTIAVPTYRKKFLDKPTGSGGGASMNFGGSKVQVTPGELQTNDNMIGGRNYSQRYDFQTKGQLIKVPTTGGYQHDSDPKAGDDGWHEITGGDYAEAELLFYDPKSDQLVFRTGQAAKNPWIDNNITFSVPRKNVPDAEKLPIMDNGKKKTLKDVLPEESKRPAGFNSVLKNSGIKWK
jgi:hypothetical protein